MSETSRIDAVMQLIRDELVRATALHGPMRSAHEGFAVLYEEVDELWDDVKRNLPQQACEEAVQVAAMAARFILDVEQNIPFPLARPTDRIMDQLLGAHGRTLP